MFKVMIIDDEPIIRKGIRSIINWKQFDCEVCAEASDGEEGKLLIAQFRPDILLTDIRMPGTDGLTMIRSVKDMVPNCKIIILTGYRDFDYVQEAIKLGVFDFVLKPSKIEELTAVLGKAVTELNCLAKRAEELDKLKNLFEQNIPVLREKLLYDILYGLNPDKGSVTEKAELLGIRIDRFILAVVEIDIDEEKRFSQYDYHLYQFGIINTIRDIFSDTFELFSIGLNGGGAAFILQNLTDEDLYTQMINEKCTYLQEMITNCFGFTVTIAISSEGTGVMQLADKLRECQEGLERKFYLGSNAIIFHGDLKGFIQFEDYSVLEKYRNLLLDGIKTGNEKIVCSRLEDIFATIETFERLDMEYLKSFYWSTIISINSIRLSLAQADNDKKVETLHLASLQRMIGESEGLPELNSLLREVSVSITEKVNQYNNRSIKLILRKAVDYLQEHYSEQVTLNDVADSVYVSTCYVSRMFKKELGRNFVDYLNGIRMDKAKELLRDPQYKTYEVAEKVGIPDAHYFSRLFKKLVGVTPTEFREIPVPRAD